MNESVVGIGARLAAAREAGGMTTAAAAARLRCDEALLLALEQERFEAIGAAVFVQGHLRRYAEFLGVPAEPLLASLAARQQEFLAPDLTRLPRAPVRSVDPRRWARLSSVVAASLVIAIAAWWILQGSGVAPPTNVESSSVQTRPIETTVSPLPPEVVAGPDIDAEPAVTATPAAAPTPAVPIVAAPVATVTQSVLTLTSSGECWVEVYDASGRRLVYDMLRPGAPIRVSVQAPVRLLLGRADIVALEWAGRTLRVPATLIRDTTARVLLAADGTFSAASPPAQGVAAP